MECMVCLRNWNQEDCIPKSLPCGHSLCTVCLEDLFNCNKVGVLCPVCNAQHKFALSELRALPKNFSLLALISDRKGITKKNPFPSGVLDLQSASQSTSLDEGSNPCHADKEFADKAISSQPYCEKHKMLLHSFVPGTKQLLCDKCISGLPKSVVQISPIPKVWLWCLCRSAKTCGKRL
eukprot:TRINITY_DN8131_c0_g3_i1.p2 TRINITY_DN8131_c0_g3~~TRINITY_DN8131_c0_g3_i1.p2  ORF type:complete len:179 (-),score=41.41 TRINITY_DN8131_c0_g3_i1:567-1103(-)